MVGVAEDEAETEGFYFFPAEGFDGAGGAYGHEAGGFDGAVRGVEASTASPGVWTGGEEFVADAVHGGVEVQKA